MVVAERVGYRLLSLIARLHHRKTVDCRSFRPLHSGGLCLPASCGLKVIAYRSTLAWVPSHRLPHGATTFTSLLSTGVSSSASSFFAAKKIFHADRAENRVHQKRVGVGKGEALADGKRRRGLATERGVALAYWHR